LIVSFSDAPVLEFIFQTVIITFLLLLFGEIMPKIYATQNALPFARKVASIFPFLLKLFSPFSYLLMSSTKIVNKRVSKYQKTNISVSELSHALELTGENITEDKDLLEGIVRFGSISVVQVMTPRMNIVDIDVESGYDEILRLIAKKGYSRMPVYAGSCDDVQGILYIKDLLPYLNEKNDFEWQKLIRKAYFVPETKKIDDLLKDFQQNKTHMAIVVDEFGGTSGIITMEDILEEIIGDISDEYDTDDKTFKKLDNNTYIFEGTIFLNDFFRITGVNEEDFAEIAGEADSLAGMILELKGEIPREKEKIEYNHYIFEILSADNRKIKKVKFQIK
jgi:gliding motility-associated protein GldE